MSSFSVWCLAADSHLKLLDRALHNIWFFLPDSLINLWKPRNLACFSMFYKTVHNDDYWFHWKLSHFANPVLITRHTAQKIEKALELTKWGFVLLFLAFKLYFIYLSKLKQLIFQNTSLTYEKYFTILVKGNKQFFVH